MKNYGKAIKKLRKNADITQAALARKLNVSSQTVSKWENGVNLPDISVIEEMCALFGVTMEEFLRLADGGALKASMLAQPERLMQTPPAPPAPPAVPAAPAAVAPLAVPAAPRRRVKPWVIILIAVIGGIYMLTAFIGGIFLAVKKPFARHSITVPTDNGNNKKVTITYMLDDDVYAQETVRASERAPELAVDFTGLGEDFSDCKFLGWYADDKYTAKYNFKTAAEKDVTLYAKLRFEESYVAYYGGSGAAGTVLGGMVKTGESLTLPANKFTLEGHKFVGWEVNGQSYAAGDSLKIDGTARVTRINAEWTGIKYTVMYTFDGQVRGREYTYGAGHSLPDKMFERTGFVQTGWQYGNKTYDLRQAIPVGLTTEDNAVLTVTPVWTGIKYKLRLDLGDIADFEGYEYCAGHYAYITGTYGENPFAEHDDPESGGLVFDGWTVYSADGSIYEGDFRYVNPDPRVVIDAKAKWVSGRYAIALYNTRFGYDLLDVLVLEGREERTLPLYSTLDDGGSSEGFHLDHWKMYSHGGPQEPLTFKDGATVSDLMVHYYFIGFDYDYIYDVDYFVEFHAVYEPNEYTISFDGNGAQGSMESLNCLYNQTVTLPANAFTKEGYTFAGWQLGDSIFEDGSAVVGLTAENGGEVTLTARWIKNSEDEIK